MEEEVLVGPEQTLEEIERIVKKEERLEATDIERIIERIAHPLSLRHRALLERIRDAHEHIKRVEKETKEIGELEKIGDHDKAAKFFVDVFMNQREIDADFTVAVFTLVYIVRALKDFYKHRMENTEYFDRLGKVLMEKVEDEKLRAEIGKILEINEQSKEPITTAMSKLGVAVRPLKIALRERLREGALIRAAKNLGKLCKIEGITDWRVGELAESKTSGKREFKK